MKDLIDRQTAIDALGERPSVYIGSAYEIAQRNQYDRDKLAIETVPSAQPELHYDEWCTDCKEYDQERHCCPRFNRVIRGTVEEYKAEQPEPCEDDPRADVYYLAEKIGIHRLYALVTALRGEPEMHHCCNCGRTANNGGWYKDGRTRCPIEEHYQLPIDGYCHLWEKRNVTDDDYPERREE